MGSYNGRQLRPDLEELQFDEEGRLKITEANIDVSDFSGFPIVNSEIENPELTVAGNTVSLGSSVNVDYTDLFDTSNSFPIPNSDLNNSSVNVAGNSVSLGDSVNVNYTDLFDTGNSFPIANSDLNNSSVNVAGNSVNLGESTSVASTDLSDSDSIDANTLQGNSPSQLSADFDGTTITENGSGNKQVDTSVRGIGWEKDGKWDVTTDDIYNLNNPSDEVLLVFHDVSDDNMNGIKLTENNVFLYDELDQEGNVSTGNNDWDLTGRDHISGFIYLQGNTNGVTALFSLSSEYVYDNASMPLTGFTEATSGTIEKILPQNSTSSNGLVEVFVR